MQILEVILYCFELDGKHFKASIGYFGYFCETLMKMYPNKQDRDVKVHHFRNVFESLLNVIMRKTKMTQEQFLDFNNKFEAHPDFDELFKCREDLGSLIKKIGLCIGHHEMYELQIQKLHSVLSGENADLENLDNIIELENILFMISFCIQLINSHDEIENFNTCLNIMFKIPSDKYAALRRSVIDILYIISEYCKELDEDMLNGFIEYVVEGFKSQSTFDVSSQCFERMILKNMNYFAGSLDKFMEYIDSFSKYLTSYSPIWSKCFTAVLSLAIYVLGNSPAEFKAAFEK
jgi:hypothetical protein